jgi:hypothetical protein
MRSMQAAVQSREAVADALLAALPEAGLRAHGSGEAAHTAIQQQRETKTDAGDCPADLGA